MPSVMDTYLVNRWEVQPNHANNFGMAHGGNVMKWMDGIGGLSAMRFAGEICVTAQMDQVNFRNPIPTGETALVESYVYDAGETSVKVRLKVYREDPQTSETEVTTGSYAVYVAINEEEAAIPVPDLAVETEQGRQLRAAARDDEADERDEPLPRGMSWEAE